MPFSSNSKSGAAIVSGTSFDSRSSKNFTKQMTVLRVVQLDDARMCTICRVKRILVTLR